MAKAKKTAEKKLHQKKKRKLLLQKLEEFGTAKATTLLTFKIKLCLQ